MASDTFWELYGWTRRGKQRRLVLSELRERPVTGQEFRKRLNAKLPADSGLSLREVSRHFTSFADKGLVRCLTSGQPYGKLYVLTDRGRRVQKELLKDSEESAV